MSYFDDASLVMIPSGYKDQKVYSVKPIDGSGDLTFSRASNATRVNSSGLVEKVRTNLALYSEDFSDTTWVKERISVSSNVTTAPDGTSTADKIVENTDNNSHRARQNANSTQGLEYTLSCFLKASERTKARVLAGGLNASADFDLSTGVIIGSPTLCTASITNVGSGWYRCAITYTQTSVTSAAQLHLIATLNAAGDFLYTGDGTSGIFVWGAMLETGVATDYIATTTTAVSVGPVSGLPRLDYSGGASCPSLLLEPQRTNLALYSEQFDNAAWAKSLCTITANQIVSPSGYLDADLVTTSGTSDTLQQSFSVTSGTTYTFSAFIKSGSTDTISLVVFSSFPTSAGTYNLTNGTATSGTGSPVVSIQDYGNGWYRATLTATATSTGTANFYFGSASANAVSTYYVWGAQVEAGAYATSYIPTLSSAVTRVGDTSTSTALQSAGLIGASAGTFFCEFIKDNTSSYFNQLITAVGTTNSSLLFDNASGGVRLRVWNSSSGVDATISTASLSVGTHKYLAKWGGGTLKVYVDGTLVGSGSVTHYAYNTYNSYESPSFSNNNIKQLLFFPTQISDADAIALTA